MTRASVTPHCRASVLIISRRLAGEFVARAFDGTDALPLVDRIALMKLVLAVDVEAARRVGLITMTTEETGHADRGLGRDGERTGRGEKACWRDPMMKMSTRCDGRADGSVGDALPVPTTSQEATR